MPKTGNILLKISTYQYQPAVPNNTTISFLLKSPIIQAYLTASCNVHKNGNTADTADCPLLDRTMLKTDTPAYL
jgi:hypothetical protein